MPFTRKLEKIIAFRLERGLQPAANQLFSGTASAMTLSTIHGIPYFDSNIGQLSEAVEDDAIENQAFPDLPQQQSLKTAGQINGPVRYQGLEAFLYSVFGFERPGFSPLTIGGGYFSHLFELEKHNISQAPYDTTFDLSGVTLASISYNASDRKNRFATIGMRTIVNDRRWRNSINTGFSFSGDASDGIIKYGSQWQAYDEGRGDYDSDTWLMPSGSTHSNQVLFRQAVLKIGPSGGLIQYGVSSWRVEVQKPVVLSQDTNSGLYIQEPELENKYSITLTITLSRHSVDTLIANRDSGTELACSIEHTSGSYKFNLYLPSLLLTESTVTDEGIAKVVLTFSPAPEPAAGNPFASEIGSHSLIHKGPLFCLYQNQESTNWMRKE